MINPFGEEEVEEEDSTSAIDPFEKEVGEEDLNLIKKNQKQMSAKHNKLAFNKLLNIV